MRLPAVIAVVLGVVASGCLRGSESSEPPIHPNPDMDYQEKYQPLEASAFFYDGKAMREPVPGTIARGELREDAAFHEGVDAGGTLLTANPVQATEALVARGAERFGIYCTPCHDKRGEGNGILTDRGKVPVPTFHQDRLRNMSDGRIFEVITDGSGLMPSYKYPINAKDRWAIIHYVRALQLKQLARAGR